jgi:cytochrome c oxidase subunit 1
VTAAPDPAPAQRRAFEAVWHDPTGPIGVLRTIQNIPLSRRYMVAAFAFFLAAGIQALLLRVQLVRPDNDFVDAQTYNQLFTMHGTTMMFLFVGPTSSAGSFSTRAFSSAPCRTAGGSPTCR